MEATKYKKVLVAEFDSTALLIAATEGRLYVTPPFTEMTLEQIEDSILEYTTPINFCVNERYRHNIVQIWHEIVYSPAFLGTLVAQKQSKQRLINHNKVFAIVASLFGNKVYDAKDLLSLHNILEHTDKRSSVYGAYTHAPYALTFEQFVTIRNIINNCHDYEPGSE